MACIEQQQFLPRGYAVQQLFDVLIFESAVRRPVKINVVCREIPVELLVDQAVAGKKNDHAVIDAGTVEPRTHGPDVFPSDVGIEQGTPFRKRRKKLRKVRCILRCIVEAHRRIAVRRHADGKHECPRRRRHGRTDFRRFFQRFQTVCVANGHLYLIPSRRQRNDYFAAPARTVDRIPGHPVQGNVVDPDVEPRESVASRVNLYSDTISVRFQR